MFHFLKRKYKLELTYDVKIHSTKSDMAYTMLTWSIQLHRLADQLIRDEALPDRNSEIYQRHRRLIQNNMDAAR